MERRLALPALTALLLAATSCNGPVRQPDEKGDLEITWEIESTTLQPRRGDLATVVFRIANRSKQVVVLRTLRYLARAVEDSAPAATWQYARQGRLSYLPTPNAWIYDRRRKGNDAPIWNSGVLVPKETITVRTKVRLLHLPKLYHLIYYRLSDEDLRDKVYWQVQRGADTRYETLFAEELSVRLFPSEQKDRKGHRLVIFPHAEPLPGESGNASIKIIRMNSPLQPRSFTLEEAVARAGMAEPFDHTYSGALQGWVLRKGRRTVWVSREGVHPLPAVRRLEQVFFFADERGVEKIEVEFLRETKTLFGDRYRLVANPREGRFFLFLSALELYKFLADVHEAGLEVDVQREGTGGRLLVTR